MEKLDYKKQLQPLYQPTAKAVVEVEVPPLNYLMVDGEGDPNTAPTYAEAVEALFALAYALKFMVKKSAGTDYAVMPLEGLWWADDMATFSVEAKSAWKWTMMILQPPFISQAMVDLAIADVQKKKHPAALAKVRLDSLHEGLCAQILHIGPFAAEGPTIEKVHHHIESTGRALHGKHHEIYLSDIRKSDPVKWKTIIRQPMR